MKQFTLLVILFFSFACAKSQTVGSKVTFKAVDGRTYTGVIKEIKNNQYRIAYDGVDFEAWLNRDQFSLSTPPAPTQTNEQGNTANNQPNQKTGDWKVGDKVEVYDIYYYKWENGTVAIVLTDRSPQQWRVSLDEPAGHAIADLSVTAAQIRARGSKPAFKLALSSRVDTYYADGSPHARGTVIEVLANGSYKVHEDGCNDKRDEVLDWSQVKPAAVLSAADPDISFLVGKWAMFVYSYPNTTVKGNDIYREYGTGAKAPPLQINANGSYVWYDEFNKPPVKGNWIADSKIEGLAMGTAKINGIIIKDSRGTLWKIYKDRENHIEARVLCSGLTQGGTRI